MGVVVVVVVDDVNVVREWVVDVMVSCEFTVFVMNIRILEVDGGVIPPLLIRRKEMLDAVLDGTIVGGGCCCGCCWCG